VCVCVIIVSRVLWKYKSSAAPYFYWDMYECGVEGEIQCTVYIYFCMCVCVCVSVSVHVERRKCVCLGIKGSLLCPASGGR